MDPKEIGIFLEISCMEKNSLAWRENLLPRMFYTVLTVFQFTLQGETEAQTSMAQ